jgi:AcrR family transcriptional regulator
VLEAVQLVVKRHGSHAVTTSRIAEVAGVSVGSLYQYFPNKRAIFTALHERHVEDVHLVIERTTVACASAPFDAFARELVEGLSNAHAEFAEVHELASSAVPESAVGFRHALHDTFERMLAGDAERWRPDGTMLFVLPRLVESLVHGAAHQVRLSRDRAKSEAIRTVLLYLSSCQGSATRGY